MSQSIYLSSLSSDQGVRINSTESLGGVDGVSGNVNLNGDTLKESIFMFSTSKQAEIIVVNGQTNMPSSLNLAEIGDYGYTLALTPASGQSSQPSLCSINSVSSINAGQYGGFIIGGYGTSSSQIAAYIKFGNQTMASGDLNPEVSIYAPSNPNKCLEVSSAGDVNKDGKIDYLFGVSGSNKAYVVFASDNLSSTISLSSSADIKISGVSGSSLGSSVTNVGDFYGTGNITFFVGATGANNYYGGGYLFSGPNLPASISTSSLGSYAITVVGNSQFNGCGAVSTYVGDVNADGKEDLLFSCRGGGSITLVFGTKNSSTTINTANLGSGGVTFTGIYNGECGYSLAGDFDFNGDKIKDFAIGCPSAAGGKGTTVVIFGSTSWPSTIDLKDIGNYGIYIYGGSSDSSGIYLSAAGNITGSSYEALNIAAPYFSDTGANITAYLVYGEGQENTINPTYMPTSIQVATDIPTLLPTLMPITTSLPTPTQTSVASLTPTVSSTSSPSFYITKTPTIEPTYFSSLSYIPTSSPLEENTNSPTIYSAFSSNDGDSSSEDEIIEISTGVSGGALLFLGLGYLIYAKMSHLWPFLKMDSDPGLRNDDIGMTTVVNNPIKAGGEIKTVFDDV